MPLKRSPILLVLAGALVLACTSEPLGPGPDLSVGQSVSIDARVQWYTSVESSCWSLATAVGRYQPTDLPADFQVSGRAVHVVLDAAPNSIGICYAGPIVHVVSIANR